MVYLYTERGIRDKIRNTFILTKSISYSEGVTKANHWSIIQIVTQARGFPSMIFILWFDALAVQEW